MKRKRKPILAALLAITMIFLSACGSNQAKAARLSAEADDEQLAEYAVEIAEYFKNRDYVSLAVLAHPVYGVVFSPSATVNLSTDKCFTPSQLASFGRDTTKYIWGVYSGDGDPIELTPEEYVSNIVFSVDYTMSEDIAVNKIEYSGNALENVTEVFPEARFVDLYMPGTDKEGQNWKILRLVFEESDGSLMLTAVIHSEYTI